jgi:hypothetical protein
MHPKLKQNYSYLFDLEAELALRKQKEEQLKAQVERLQIDLRSVTSSLESSEFKHAHFLSLEAELAVRKQKEEQLKAQVESLQIDLRSATSSLESSEFKHSQFLSLEAQVTFHRQATENLMERELLNLRKIASLKSEISGLLKKKKTKKSHGMRLRKRAEKN